MTVQVILDEKPIDFKVIRFSDGATSVVAPDNMPVDYDNVLISIDNLPADSYYTVIRQVLDILKLTAGEFARVHLNLSYLPYARADREFGEGYANPLDSFMEFLSGFWFDSITMLDVHNPKVVKDLNDEHMVTPELILVPRLNAFKNTVNRESKLKEILLYDPVFCAPDKGAVKATLEIAEFYGKEYVLCEKTRNPHNGFITGLEITAGANVEGRSVLITDDICDGGATFDIAARALKEKGAKEVYLYVTHGIFSKGIESLTNLDGVFFYNKVNV